MNTIDNRQRGVTMLELMVVLAIGAILVMVAVPSFLVTRHHLNLQGAAQRLVGDLRMAQALAVRQDGVYTINFDPANDTYWFSCTSCGTDPLPPARQLADASYWQLIGGMGNIDLVAVKDTNDTGGSRTSVSFDGGGYVSVPTSNLPLVVELRATQSGETIAVQICRTGKLKTFAIEENFHNTTLNGHLPSC